MTAPRAARASGSALLAGLAAGMLIVGAACGDGNQSTAADAVGQVDALGLTRDSSVLSADGASTTTLTATTNPQLHPAGTLVAFTTTSGGFLPTGTTLTAVTDNKGAARVALKSGTDLVTARLTAVAANLIAFDSIAFVQALPDFVTLAVDRTTLQPSAASATNTVKLSATISRRLGSLTAGQKIRFTAHPNTAGGTMKGVIVNPASVVATGAAAAPMTASASLFVNDSTPTESITIVAQADGPNGGTVSDSVTVEVQNPSVLLAHSSVRGAVLRSRSWRKPARP